MAKLLKAILDTNVIVAALHSPAGGSAKILQAISMSLILGGVSSSTREEIERNLYKFKTGIMPEFNQLISRNLEQIKPDALQVNHFSEFVDPDDAHLLASCVLWNADYLVSLNRKHLIDNQKAQSVMKARIVTPKELIQEIGL